MSITIGRLNLEYAVAQLEDGDVERTATEVEYCDLLFFLSLVKTVCESSGCRLVYDTAYFQTCDLTGVLGGLTLRVIEICGDCDDSLGYGLTKIVFGSFLHFLENHS